MLVWWTEKTTEITQNVHIAEAHFIKVGLNWWKSSRLKYCCPLTDLTPCSLLGLANPVHSANGLELVSGVEDWLHQQHVGRFDDVQTIGAGVERKEENVDLFFVFEGAQILLEN